MQCISYMKINHIAHMVYFGKFGIYSCRSSTHGRVHLSREVHTDDIHTKFSILYYSCTRNKSIL
jgi:hypothetical protein